MKWLRMPLPADVCTLEGIRALGAACRQHEDGLGILVDIAGAAWAR